MKTDLAKFIDHTLLKADAKASDIARLCREAKECGFKSVCVNPCWVAKCREALNLFAYSGLGSLALARGGARVCHLDAARGMIEWGKANLELNPEIPPKVRWIVDDVMKFARREVRRNMKYDLIALDPPTFGRGSSGQVWKIEDDLPKLLELCRELRDPERPFELVLSCHSPGFSVLVLERIVAQVFGRGEFESGEMTIPESTGRKLPAGVSVIFRCE